MPSISLSQPTALTVITAGLHSTNYNALSSLLNGGLDNANIAAGANISPSKLLLPGTTTTFLRGDGTFTTVPVATYGTALPSSPIDGQEHVLVDSTSAPTYQWRFRYNSGSGSSYKWEFIGGNQKFVEVATVQSTSSTSYTALATAGPSFTLPNAGDWMIGVGSYVQGFDQVSHMSYDVGGTGANDVWSTGTPLTGGGTSLVGTGTRYRRWDGLAASTAIVSKYRNMFASNCDYGYRQLFVQPIRVS